MMVLEVKRARWEETLLEQVERTGRTSSIASFDHSVIAALRAATRRSPWASPFYGYLVDVAEYAQRLGATLVSSRNYRFVDEEMVAVAVTRAASA